MYLYICYIFGKFGIIIILGDPTCFLVIYNFISSIFTYKVLLAAEGLQYSYSTLESKGILLSADPAFTFSIHLLKCFNRDHETTRKPQQWLAAKLKLKTVSHQKFHFSLFFFPLRDKHI